MSDGTLNITARLEKNYRDELASLFPGAIGKGGRNSQGFKKALVRPINRTAAKAVSFISKAISSRVNIKQGDIKKYIKTVPKKATADNLRVTVVLSKTKRLPLVYFGASQGKKGVSYRIAKKGGRKTIEGTFIAALKGKRDGEANTHVVERQKVDQALQGLYRTIRKRKKTHKKVERVGRLPLTNPKRGPSPWGVFVKSGAIKEAKLELGAYLNEQVRQAIKYVRMKQAKSDA